MLDVKGCHTYYGQAHILRGVSIRVGEGKVTALIGRNGMGKTTLVRSIMGLTPPQRGELRFLSKDIGKLEPEEIARLGIGLVPQGRGIFPSLRVHENLTIASRSRMRGEQRWSLERIYERFPVLRARARSWGDHLSGGEQQMLAIARALMAGPRCILMDEPFEGLAPGMVEEVVRVVRDVANEGAAVLLVGQLVGTATDVADRVFVMGKGEIVFEGQPDQLRKQDEILTTYLGVGGPG